ncbi:hypothetical protein Aperf_G00000126884 [Anoplocephala perfoliata]
MSSHVRRLQYQQQQQRQAQLQRNYASNGSFSSFGRNREDRPLEYESSNHAIAYSQLSGVSGAGRHFPGSVVSFDQRSNNRNLPEGSIMSFNPPSTFASRSMLGRPSLYAKSNVYRSRSLGASKASLATVQSGRSTIQAEHRDRKVQLLIRAVDFRRATKPYFWSVFFFTFFLFTLFLGLLIICLRHVYMNLLLSVDIGESIGPLLCGLSFLFLGIGFKFLYDAYQTGARERKKIKYVSDSAYTVAVKVTAPPAVDATEELQSGKTTDKALTRAPIGTRTVNASKSEKVESVQVLRRRLMPQPFLDISSRVDIKIDLLEDFPTVNRPKYIQCIRFLLQQSNPRWSAFGINNVIFQGSVQPTPVQSSEDVSNIFKFCRRLCRNGESVPPSTN